MKNIYFIILFSLLNISCFAQTKNLFKVKETYSDKNFEHVEKTLLKNSDSVFFQDNKYIVRRTCDGEFGGTIWFKNKKTGIEYSCESTCPVNVIKINGKYIVTNSLAHLDGYSQIIEINNPDSMAIFSPPKPREIKGRIKIYYDGDNESKSTKGRKELVDSVGILTLASFSYKNKIYSIVINPKTIFISAIKNGKFITVDTISNKSLWWTNSQVIKAKNNHLIVIFNGDVNGYFDIHKNKINLKIFKKTAPNKSS